MRKNLIKSTCGECDGKGYVMVTKLSELRKKDGLDQTAVAEALGLTRTSVSNIERGVQAITLDKVKKMAELYSVDEFEMYKTARDSLGTNKGLSYE